MAQWVNQPTFDFGSGHDLTVHGIEPCIQLCADSNGAYLGFSLLLCLSLAHTHVRALSLKINKRFKNFFLKMKVSRGMSRCDSYVSQFPSNFKASGNKCT